MSFALHATHSPVVLDIQPSHIKAVQIVKRRGMWHEHLSISIQRKRFNEHQALPPTSLNEAEIALLFDALDRQGAYGSAMAVLVPSALTATHLLELPPRDANVPIELLARAEMARLCRWEDSQPFQMLHWPVPMLSRAGRDEKTAPTTLGAVAMLETELDALIAQLSVRGASIVAAVAAPLAAAEAACWLSAGDAAGSTGIVVDVQWDRSSLAVVRDGALLYHRDLPDNGLMLLARGLAAELRIGEAEAIDAIELGTIGLDGTSPRAAALCESFVESLAAECEATFDFVTRRYGGASLTRASVLGEGAKIKGIGEELCRGLGIGSVPSHPPAALNSAIPAGAARLLTKRPKDHGLLSRHARGVLQSERVGRAWAIGSLATAAVAAVATGALYLATWKSVHLEETRLAAIAHEQSQANAKAAALTKQLKDVQTAMDLHATLAKQPDMSDLVRVIENTLSRAAILTELNLTDPLSEPVSAQKPKARPFKHLRMCGTVTDSQALMDQVTRLKAIDIFENVELARSGRSPDGQSVSFDLSFDVVFQPNRGGRHDAIPGIHP